MVDALGIFENDHVASRIRVSGIAFILDPEGTSTRGVRNAISLDEFGARVRTATRT
jgi:hypothetical protein